MDKLSKCVNMTVGVRQRDLRWDLDRCIQVKSGISGQYVYRSLYAAQLDRCTDSIDQDNMLVLISEHLKDDMALALHNISDFLGLHLHDASFQEGSSSMELSVAKHFPKFENHTGWRLHSEYGAMDGRLRQQLESFFGVPNQLLSDSIAVDLNRLWGYEMVF